MTRKSFDQIVTRIIASMIFFFYTGGISFVLIKDSMNNFENFTKEPLMFSAFIIWGLCATAFGVYLWKDKVKTL
jgi:hypothetical protein